MIEWKKKNLSEFVTFQRGYDLPQYNFINGAVPVYGSTSILGYHNESKVKFPGVITGRSGTLGKFQYSKKDFWPHNTTLWVKDFKGNDPKFSYYLMQSLDFSELNGGGAVPTLNRNVLSSFKLNVPELNTQKKIGNYLFNYDELIKNHYKKIKLYEEYCKLTFEELFLRYKKNGKKLKLNKKTNLPNFWTKLILDDYTDIISKGPSLNYDIKNFKGVEVLNQKSVNYGEIELKSILIARELSKEKDTYYLKINDILVNSMGQGTLGRVSKNVSINKKMIIHNCITFLRAKKKYSQFLLFYFISAHQDYFEVVAHGSTGQTTLKEKDIKKLYIPLPDEKFLKEFDSLIEPIWKKIGVLKKKIYLLEQVKRIYRPRLTTGFINTNKL
tara:strand:- start:3297 stop:4451 length:1155 start_codon:yes stop_codon:yes gene_type:complete